MERKGLKARVFDGKKLANTINKEIRKEIDQMVAKGHRLVAWVSHPLCATSDPSPFPLFLCLPHTMNAAGSGGQQVMIIM